jgi:LCP family protein required for cell wall assembly
MRRVFGRRHDAEVSASDDAEVSASDEDGGQPPRIGQSRHDPGWAHVVILVGLVLILVSGAVVAGGQLLLSRYVGSVHQAHLLGGAALTPSANNRLVHARINGPINVLLAGIDERADNPAGGARADSIIVAHIPASRDRVYLISIPRDSRVEIPTYRKTSYPGGTDKVNAAFAFGFSEVGGRAGGFELLALTIKQLTGVSFNAGAIINFDGLRSGVDAVGGVDMCVDEETISVHVGEDSAGKLAAPYRLVPPDYHPVPVHGVRPQVYHVGCQLLAGWQALDYVRQRELIPDGEYGRQRHQQQLITALAKKISKAGGLTDPLAADRILRSMGSAVTFDGNGASLADWMFALKSMDPNAITMVKTNGGQYTTQVVDGQEFELLTDTTRQLFSAIRDDTLGEFVAAHPDWVSGTAAP